MVGQNDRRVFQGAYNMQSAVNIDAYTGAVLLETRNPGRKAGKMIEVVGNVDRRPAARNSEEGKCISSTSV